jgi:hypothetical protein
MANVPIHAVLRDNAPLLGLAGKETWPDKQL